MAAEAFRPDIQALRAIAVLFVLAFHVWPTHVRGGYIGVDVFFVISGYLITGHLVREVAATGRVDLTGFYARRARRLLPAASLTLVAVALASYVWMPASTWQTTAADILASTTYVQNWVLVQRSVDYLAQDATPSPLQHFWSLAVEEQFYFVWPLVIAGVAAVWKRCSGTDTTNDEGEGLSPSAGRPSFSSPTGFAYAAPMGVLCFISFVAAVYYARYDPAPGYFMTHVRLHEMGIGGLLAVWAAGHTSAGQAQDIGLPSKQTALDFRIRSVGAAGGLICIAGPAFLYTTRLPFPGLAATVPVLGAVLAIGSGELCASNGLEAAHALAPLLANSWLQYLGSISYSLYLAHWPVVVVYPFATGKDAGSSVADAAFVLLLSLALAHACKLCWEDRFRTAGQGTPGHRRGATTCPDSLASPFKDISDSRRIRSAKTRKRGPSGTSHGIRDDVKFAAAMAASMACVTLLCSLAIYTCALNLAADDLVHEEVEFANFQTAGFNQSGVTSRMQGPSLVDHPWCSKIYGPVVQHPGADVVYYGCSTLNSLPVTEATPRIGVAIKEFSMTDQLEESWTPPNASTPHGHVMLMGDSHAKLSWGPAFGAVARRMGFQFTNLGRNNCPPTLTVIHGRNETGAKAHFDCRDWVQSSVDAVLREKPSIVALVAAVRPSSDAAVADGVVQVVKAIVAAGIPVVGIKATPRFSELVPACLMREVKRNRVNSNISACSVEDIGEKSCVHQAAEMHPVLRLLSLDRYFCPNSTCPPVIGNVVVYRDKLHLTRAFSKTMANALQEEMLAAAPHLKSLVKMQ